MGTFTFAFVCSVMLLCVCISRLVWRQCVVLPYRLCEDDCIKVFDKFSRDMKHDSFHGLSVLLTYEYEWAGFPWADVWAR